MEGNWAPLALYSWKIKLTSARRLGLKHSVYILLFNMQLFNAILIWMLTAVQN